MVITYVYDVIFGYIMFFYSEGQGTKIKEVAEKSRCLDCTGRLLKRFSHLWYRHSVSIKPNET